MAALQLIIYALQLEQGKYYVGKTHRFEGFDGIEFCFQEHLEGRGSEWTKKYYPISIIESYEHHSTFEEDVLTKKYMMKYGIENVRGGSYTTIDLEEWQVKSLEHEFKSISDKCFKCGKNGHFAKDCGKGLFLEYLSAFETEEKIDEEIARMENVVKKVNELHTYIFYYRYVQIINDKNETIAIEVEPSMIDTYNMRNLKWDERQFRNNPRSTTSERIYASLLRYKGDGNKHNIVDDKNIVQNIYKVYIYRRRLERQYIEIVNNENVDDSISIDNTDQLIQIINKKIELLYEKLIDLITF